MLPLAEIGAAPEIPALAALLAAGAALFAWVFAQGALVVWRRSLGKLLGWLAGILDKASINVGFKTIHVFGPLSSALRSLEATVDHYLAEAALWAERGASTFFRFFIDLNVWMGRELADLATDTWHALGNVRSAVVAPAIAAAEHRLALTVRKLTVSVADLERVTIPGLRHRIAGAERLLEHDWQRLARGIDRLAGVSAHALAEKFARVLGTTAAIEHSLGRLEKRVARAERKLSGTAAVALVLTALASVGFSFLRCSAWQSAARKLTCGMGSLLDELLALSIDALLIADLCAVTQAIGAAVELAAPAIDELGNGLGELLDCQGSSRPPDFPLRAVALPAGPYPLTAA